MLRPSRLFFEVHQPAPSGVLLPAPHRICPSRTAPGGTRCLASLTSGSRRQIPGFGSSTTRWWTSSWLPSTATGRVWSGFLSFPREPHRDPFPRELSDFFVSNAHYRFQPTSSISIGIDIFVSTMANSDPSPPPTPTADDMTEKQRLGMAFYRIELHQLPQLPGAAGRLRGPTPASATSEPSATRMTGARIRP